MASRATEIWRSCRLAEQSRGGRRRLSASTSTSKQRTEIDNAGSGLARAGQAAGTPCGGVPGPMSTAIPRHFPCAKRNALRPKRVA